MELLLLVVVNFVLVAAIVWANIKVKRLDKQFAPVLHEAGLDDLRSRVPEAKSLGMNWAMLPAINFGRLESGDQEKLKKIIREHRETIVRAYWWGLLQITSQAIFYGMFGVLTTHVWMKYLLAGAIIILAGVAIPTFIAYTRGIRRLPQLCHKPFS